ncbi:hypothetical protein HW555_013303 [Spodoptera exigua]|uniref:Uncharacterized protein n=1 Tax=Spodoptera exigua TaxID=7107 RepID=A0A835G4Z9_SPOEX|nr:hypothetical protein HW555_013303 [Spodoptera exigua]
MNDISLSYSVLKPQRAIAQRVARAYRTVGFAAACALAGTPPWELEAWVLTRVYDWTAEQRALNRSPGPRERENVREEDNFVSRTLEFTVRTTPSLR